MAKKKAAAHGGGGHGWFVTFADLMGLLVAFFVMLVELAPVSLDTTLSFGTEKE
jgi:chemotaxis protein MotB